MRLAPSLWIFASSVSMAIARSVRGVHTLSLLIIIEVIISDRTSFPISDMNSIEPADR